MKISVLLRAADFRGDHAADVTIAHELLPGETVEALVRRLLDPNERLHPSHDWIELRVVQEAPEPEP